MNETQTVRPPTWFWVMAILALLWNLMGLLAFIFQLLMSPEVLASLPENEQELYRDMPLWATVAFGLAVIAGTLGCIFLILRTRLAMVLFVLSLVGIVLQDAHNFLFSNVLEVYGPGSLIMPVVVLIIALLLIVMSRRADRLGWLR